MDNRGSGYVIEVFVPCDPRDPAGMRAALNVLEAIVNGPHALSGMEVDGPTWRPATRPRKVKAAAARAADKGPELPLNTADAGPGVVVHAATNADVVAAEAAGDALPEFLRR